MAAQIPVVGTIFNPDDSGYRPQFTQPGGPGTPTFPQQQPGEMLGLFVIPYCGHWVNNLMIRKCAVNGVASAICCCPVCDVCARIITPYDDIYSFANEPIIV